MRLRVLAAVLMLAQGASAAVTLRGTASGDPTPGRTTTPGVVTNGDFSIFRIGSDGSIVGDGIDEHTFWIHDFSADPELASIDRNTPLISATLRLTLTPAASPVRDRAAIFGLAEFQSPLFDAIPVDLTRTVAIDLCEIYSDLQILSTLFGSSPQLDPRIPQSGPGQLTLGYANDAVVSFAELELVAVPEPGSGLLVALGLLPLTRRWTRAAPRGSGPRLTQRTRAAASSAPGARGCDGSSP